MEPQPTLAEHRPGPANPRLNRRLITGLVALVVLAAVAIIVLLISRSGLSAPAAEQPTIWQEITAGITDGQMSKDGALEAFAYVYRVSIPGVQVPAGREGGDVPTTGSGVTRWVQAHWAELSPDQQAVINRFITAGPGDVVVNIDQSSASRSVPKLLGLAGTAAPVGVLAVDTPMTDAFKTELLGDIQHIGPKLGIPPISTAGVRFISRVTLTMSEQDGGSVLMEAAGLDLRGLWSPCNVTVYKNAWSKLPLVGGKVSDIAHVLMTHEVVHCYQNVIWGSYAVASAIPPWIVEGSAMWLAADDTHVAEPWMPFMWNDYLESETALTNRNYDGYGYYSLLDHEGRNLWALMAPAWRAAAASTTTRSDPYIAVLDGDASDVRDAWATSYLRRNDWQDPWLMYGFGLPDKAQVVPRPIQAVSLGWPGTLASRSNSIVQVQGSDGEVVAVETTGLVSAHDESSDMVLDFTSERMCTVDSCVCKPGTLREGEDMAEQHMSLPFTLAFNAPRGGSTYVVTGLKLDDLCGQKPSPPPGLGTVAGPPCAAVPCAGDNGDPHLVAVDLHRYDFQAAGEFTLLRSADGTAEIQGRQEPYASSDHVSINTAIAARVSGHRVGIYMTGAGLEVRVDGVVTAVTAPVDLGSGGRIVAYPKGYEIDFPDGTALWAMSVKQWGINAQIRPSTALRKSGVGLLGPILPGGLGVPAMPDGTRLPRAADQHTAYLELYQTLADGWRVTDATTLFDYAPGTSTSTFTKAGFPTESNTLTLSQLPGDVQAAAQLQCILILDADLRDECAFDVATTGQPGIGDLYQLTQAFLDDGPVGLGANPGAPGPSPDASAAPIGPLPTDTPPPSAGPPPAGITQLIPLIVNLHGAALGPDGTMFLSVELPDNHFEVVAADPAAGTIRQQVDTPGAGVLAFASGSVWLGGKDAAGDCTITRMDATSLAVQVTIVVACQIDQPVFASLGGAIWFVDQSKVDDNDLGTVLRRIDPATNRVDATGVALPYSNGFLGYSPGSTAIIYGDLAKDVRFLADGSSAFQSLGKLGFPLYAVGRGAWTEAFGTQTATLVGPGGAILATVPVDGSIVGGDDQAVYVSGEAAADGSDTLWRYPADGSNPVQIAQAARVDTGGATADLGYFDNDPFLFGPHEAVKIWLVSPATNPGLYSVDIQQVALP